MVVAPPSPPRSRRRIWIICAVVVVLLIVLIVPLAVLLPDDGNGGHSHSNEHKPWPAQEYKSVDFVAPDLEITRTGQTQPGYLMFTPMGPGTPAHAPLIMTDTNELVWQGEDGQGHGHNNLRVSTYNGEPVISYWKGFGANEGHFGHGYGEVQILNNKYETLSTICMDDLNIVTPDPDNYPGQEERPCFLDYHESYITDDGAIMVTAYNVTRTDLREFGGKEDGWIFDALFFKIDIETKKVLFRWSALENVPLNTSNYRNSTGGLQLGQRLFGEHQHNPWDFFHMNSVQPVPGGYLVNSRMTWSFYLVDGETGKVKWTLEGSQGGDFKLDDGIFFAWQHEPRMEDITPQGFRVTLFNNDNINPPLWRIVNQSTGYLLDVNTHTKRVTSVRDLVDSDDKVFAEAEGSYEALANGHVILGYGSEPIFKEFDAQNNVVWTGQFGRADTKTHSYRVYRSDWQAQPSKPPDVAAISSTGNSGKSSVAIYASWNGATEYDGWSFYAGNTRDSLKPVGRAKKAGFETAHNVRGPWKYFRADAMKGDQVLHRSNVVTLSSKKQGHHARMPSR